MSLLPEALRAKLPKLYSQDGNCNPTIHLKFFLPGTIWTWYVAEGEVQEDDYLFFGYVVGPDSEWGYFLLSELEAVGKAFITGVERDLYFTSAPWTQVEEHHRQEHGL